VTEITEITEKHRQKVNRKPLTVREIVEDTETQTRMVTGYTSVVTIRSLGKNQTETQRESLRDQIRSDRNHLKHTESP